MPSSGDVARSASAVGLGRVGERRLGSTTRKAFSVGWLALIACRERRVSRSEVTCGWPADTAGQGQRGQAWPPDPKTGRDRPKRQPRFETNGADTADVAVGCETIEMRLYRDRAVVLRQHKLGEADRIVTLLTRDHGLVRAVAKGVRRTRSKFGARLEPFAHIDVQLHPGRNLDIVTQVVSIDAFATDIVNDYGRYTCGCAMLETAERLAGEERAPAPDLHRLTVSALRAVADGRRSRDLLLDAYLLRAMGIAGWAPALNECARCATPGPHRAFHIGAGGSVCGTAARPVRPHRRREWST